MCALWVSGRETDRAIMCWKSIKRGRVGIVQANVQAKRGYLYECPFVVGSGHVWGWRREHCWQCAL